MRFRFPLVFSVGLAIAACAADSADEKQVNAVATATAVKDCVGGPRPNSGYGVVPAFGGQAFPNAVALLPLPNDNDHFLVVRKTGLIHRIATDGSQSLFIDMKDKVNSSPNEAGLLGVALHPSFKTNGLVFLSYTKPSATSPANLRSVIARAKSNDGGLTLDKASFVELLQFDQPYSNHNGGHVTFGPDGFLYASFGDGGSGGDPQGNGQKKDVWFGKIHRLDVDHPSAGLEYSIPSDNPFASGGGKPEIYAFGLRNTWRFNFDKLTGELWAGDVGQNKYEEVDRIQLGGNYGWGVREGLHCYKPEPCPEVPGAINPVVEYDHSQGYSITGGYVYRGSDIPDLVGQYVFGDFGGKIWSIPTNVTDGTPATMKTLVSSSMSISSFGQDNKGELYVLDYGAGKINRLVQQVSSDGLPTKLSQTGCVSPTDPKVIDPKLIAYNVNSPLWSDGADKGRWMNLPPGGKITLASDGDMDLPTGTVLVKEFQVGGKRVETRLFVRHTDNTWAGYTYEWDDAQTDATLLVDGKVKAVPLPDGTTQPWTYPSRAQCMTCHNSAAGGSLGLELAQINREGQLENWNARGLFVTPPTSYAAPLPSPADELLAAETRARSYLHANCSFCHRPGGPGRGAADFRFSRSFKGTKVCNTPPESGDLGVADAKLFTPGAPEKSLISLRTHALDENRMPPLASAVVDPLGTSIIDAWIRDVMACP